MKKSILILSSFLLVLVSINLVSAALPAPPAAFDEIANVFRDLLVSDSGEDMVARLLLVMLLTSVLFFPAHKLVQGKSGLAFFIAFIVSVLGIRAFPNIQGLLLPYSTLAVAVSAILPFLLFAYLISAESNSPVIRKIGWAIMATAFICLWWMRWDEIGEIAYIYFWMGIAALAVLFFLDDTLSKWWYLSGTYVRTKQAADLQIQRIQTEIEDLIKEMNDLPNESYRITYRNKIKKLKEAQKALAAF